MSGICYRSPVSPQILVETILDGAAPSALTLDMLMRDLPLDWAAQRRKLSG